MEVAQCHVDSVAKIFGINYIRELITDKTDVYDFHDFAASQKVTSSL